MFGNRQYYKGGRGTGPLRTFQFNTVGKIAGDGPPITPLIFGDPVGGGQGFWRDISASYDTFFFGGVVDPTINNVNDVQGWQPKNGLLAGASNLTHFDEGFKFQQFQQLLLTTKLLVTKITIQCLRLVSFNVAENFILQAGTGSFPDAVGIYDGNENRNYMQRVSPNAYISPFNGQPNNGSGNDVPAFFVEIPCEVVLGPQSAIIIDLTRDQFPMVCMVSLTAQKFE